MIIFASYNMKGGVGKTSSVVNLAHLCASEGARTLLWDLDPQGAATFHFRAEPLHVEKLKKLFKDEKRLGSSVEHSPYPGLDILPAGFEYRHMDVVLGDEKKSRKKLVKSLQALGSNYDALFLDCPPSISALSEAVFHASDCVLMPVIPSVLAVSSFERVRDYLAGTANGDTRILAFYSMVDRRRTLHRTLVAQASRHPEFCESAIPARSSIERMGVEQAPVTAFAPESDAAAAYKALWAEIKRRVAEPA